MNGFHLAAYATLALDASAGDVQVNAVVDQLLVIAANRFRMASKMKILFAYVGSIGLTRARIVTPHFRVPALPQIMPGNVTLIVPTNYNIMDLRSSPLELETNTDVEIQATNAAANTVIAFLGLVEDVPNVEPPTGDLRWVRFTAVPSSLALAWSGRGEITFQDTLDSGRYGVYGMQVDGATQLASRLIFNNQYLRPGCIGFATSTLKPHPMFEGGLGLWGTFENSTPPGIEVFNSAAAVVVYNGLMLVKWLGPN